MNASEYFEKEMGEQVRWFEAARNDRDRETYAGQIIQTISRALKRPGLYGDQSELLAAMSPEARSFYEQSQEKWPAITTRSEIVRRRKLALKFAEVFLAEIPGGVLCPK